MLNLRNQGNLPYLCSILLLLPLVDTRVHDFLGRFTLWIASEIDRCDWIIRQCWAYLLLSCKKMDRARCADPEGLLCIGIHSGLADTAISGYNEFETLRGTG